MDRLKINNIPHPAEVLNKEEYIDVSDGHNLDGIAMSLYIEEMKKNSNQQKTDDQNFSEAQKEIAKEYLKYLLQSRSITSSTNVQDTEKLLVSKITEFKQKLTTIEAKLGSLKSKLEEEKHKTNAQRVMNKEAGFSTLHFDDIHYLKGDIRSTAEHYNTWLKARTTDEINQRYKLADKSFGYRFLILLGENQIDMKGNKTR